MIGDGDCEEFPLRKGGRRRRGGCLMRSEDQASFVTHDRVSPNLQDNPWRLRRQGLSCKLGETLSCVTKEA